MPINKNAFIRLKIIHELMKEKEKGWTKPRLLIELNKRLNSRHHLPPISISALRYDLFDLEVEFKAPIQSEKIGRHTWYSYDGPDFQLLDAETRELEGKIIELQDKVDKLSTEVEYWKDLYELELTNSQYESH